MKPIDRFLGKDRSFWSYVKLISETAGYSTRKHKGEEPALRTYELDDVQSTLRTKGLSTLEVFSPDGMPTRLAMEIVDYLNARKDLLEAYAEPNLQDEAKARTMFETALQRCPTGTLSIQMNRQKGNKRHPMYLVNTINLLTQTVLKGQGFVPDAGCLVTITGADNQLLRVPSRRFDGAYPSTHNPVAIWEVKEYYGTTTFGSRVADGIYETCLDGEELLEVRQSTGISVKHYLMVDDYFTWWTSGRSYLCRLVDAVHMGLLDEVLFGREVVDRWPLIVASWQIPSLNPGNK